MRSGTFRLTSASQDDQERQTAQSVLRSVVSKVRRSEWWSYNTTEPGDLRYLGLIAVWIRWVIGLICLLLLFYRPDFDYLRYAGFALILVVLAALNGFTHFRLQTNRLVTLSWILGLSVMDIALISGAIVAGREFNHYFFQLLYYPALAAFAVISGSLLTTMVWTTAVALLYILVSLLAVGDFSFEDKDEKTLFVRICVMYAIAVFFNLVAGIERRRRQEAVNRERELHRERIELSQTIHDTTAQSAYMIGLGIESAIELADKANRELAEKLQATYRLSKSVMWELRHPIDNGLIFEGRELGHVLEAHARTFTAITSVSADVRQTGTEAPLSSATRSLLFSIAHNALTNAFRHSQAANVTIELDFQENSLRMSLADDGIGLPDDYNERGHGFRNMRNEAERIGGRLEVNSGGPGEGTTVTCIIEYDEN